MRKRNTQTKKLVWDILCQSSHALCQEDVQQLAGLQLDRVTLYRILQSFTEDGILHKIVDTTGKLFYATGVENINTDKHLENHIHCKCIKCGKIHCFQQEVIPSLPEGFELSRVHCIVEGTCIQCVAKRKSEEEGLAV